MLHLDGSHRFRQGASRWPSAPTAPAATSSRAPISAIEVIYDEGEPPLVAVLAEDAMMKLRMTRRMHTYRDVTDADIRPQIAGIARASRARPTSTGPRYDVVQQLNQSDLAFLR